MSPVRASSVSKSCSRLGVPRLQHARAMPGSTQSRRRQPRGNAAEHPPGRVPISPPSTPSGELLSSPSFPSPGPPSPLPPFPRSVCAPSARPVDPGALVQLHRKLARLDQQEAQRAGQQGPAERDPGQALAPGARHLLRAAVQMLGQGEGSVAVHRQARFAVKNAGQVGVLRGGWEWAVVSTRWGRQGTRALPSIPQCWHRCQTRGAALNRSLLGANPTPSPPRSTPVAGRQTRFGRRPGRDPAHPGREPLPTLRVACPS